MASPAQPRTAQTTLLSLDDVKPSINASGDSGAIKAFPASPANIIVGELSAQVTPDGLFKLPRVDNAPVSFL